MKGVRLNELGKESENGKSIKSFKKKREKFRKNNLQFV